MKRLLYLMSALVIVSSFSVAAGRSYAAPSHAKMINIRLCASAPIGVPTLKHTVQGIFNAVNLATIQWRSKFKAAGSALLTPTTLDDAKSDGSTYSTDVERSNALKCIADKTVFGYVGTLNSGAALVSEPLLNSAAMVQISPANSNTTLTSPKSRATQEPFTYQHKIPGSYLTYYRTVTTDALQGPADALIMKNQLHVSKYFLIDDKQAYGAGLAAAMSAYASKIGLQRIGFSHIDPSDSSTIATSTDAVADQVVAAHPQGVFFGGDAETGIALPRRLRAKGYTGPIMGGDAIYETSWITNAGAKGALNNYATSFGPDPSTAAASFRRAYNQTFHTYLDAYDAPSYDAANIILNAIYKALKKGKFQKQGNLFHKRASVLPFVASTKWKGSIGTTSFDRNGDTFNRIISAYVVKNSKWVYFRQAPKVKGVLPTS